LGRSKKRSGSDSRKRARKKRSRTTRDDSGSVAPSPTASWSALLPALGAAIASGALYFLAFPGFDLWPLALVALVPLLWALDSPPGGHRFTNKQVVLVGVVFGWATNLGGYYWLVGMLEDFSGFGFALCVLFASILCAFQGGLLALFAWLYFRARGRGWPALLVAPAAFGAAEITYPLLFQSYYGNHFHGLPALVQIADLGGPILVTVLAVAVNATLYELLRARVQRTRLPWRGAVGVAVAVALTAVYGVIRIAQIDARSAESPAVTVGLVQTNMGIFQKREDPMEGRRRHIEMSRDLEETVQPDLLVWPESAATFFLPEETTNVSRHVMGPVTTPLLFGGLARRTVDGRERHYNTAYLVDAEGEILGTYDKTYLLMFGEYLPFGDEIPELYDISRHSGRFSPGDHVRPLEWGDYRITALVCYEDIIPRFTRRAVREGDPHLLVNMTNDAWFGDTSEPWQHLALAKMRAIEHHRWLVRATNSGVSAIVDPVGRVTEEIGVFERGTIHGDVRMMQGWTLYQTLGDWPGWISLGVVVVIGFVRRRRDWFPAA
jgi:apolipoprotein N-acyltransferase